MKIENNNSPYQREKLQDKIKDIKYKITTINERTLSILNEIRKLKIVHKVG